MFELIDPVEPEEELKPVKPLTLGKLILGVALGILLASVIGGIVYRFAVVVPTEKAAAKRAADETLTQSLKSINEDAARMRAQDAYVEQQAHAAQPGSPCSKFWGTDFWDCNKLKTLAEKRKYAQMIAWDSRH